MRKFIVIALMSIITIVTYGQRKQKFGDGVYSTVKSNKTIRTEEHEDWLKEYRLKKEAERKIDSLYNTYGKCDCGYIRMGCEYDHKPQGDWFEKEPTFLKIGELTMPITLITSGYGMDGPKYYGYVVPEEYATSVAEYFERNYKKLDCSGYLNTLFASRLKFSQYIDPSNERVMFSVGEKFYGSLYIFITDRLTDYNHRIEKKEHDDAIERRKTKTIESLTNAPKIVL